MDIEEVKNENLVYFGERIEPYFASSIIIRGMLDQRNVRDVLGWDAGVRWMYTNNYFFIIKNDLDAAKKELDDKFNDRSGNYAQKLITKCFAYGKKLIITAKGIKTKAERSDLDLAKMHELLAAYHKAASNYMIFQNIALFEDSVAKLAQSLVKKYAHTEREANLLLQLITASNQLTAGEAEQDDLLRLCMKKDRDALAAKHADRYGWLALRFFVGAPWTKEDIIKRIEHHTPEDAKAEIENKIKHRNEKEQEIKQSIKRFSKEDRKKVKLIRDIVFLRTQRTDFFQESSYYVYDLVKKIAEKLGVSYDSLMYLGIEEILLSLEGKLDYRECIQVRKGGFLVFFDNEKDRILEGDAVEKYIQSRPTLNRNTDKINEFTGNIGFKGHVTGRAKIVKTDADNVKFMRGDILVAIMTTPNLTPSMEKAAAIITDEGGITCHAAIFAREMKKPCITGTKIATKAISDGDLIEVDADKGIVKILKKYRN
jgi:phosphohistidine swiveling domain-containing protein